MLKKIFFTLFLASILLLLKVQIVAAQASDSLGADDLSGTNLGTNNLVDIVSNIINIFLGFLGIIAVILIIYGGWLWMTSQGNGEQIEKAKLLLVSAVIGLTIILSAFVIAKFVISKIADATGAGNGNNNGGQVIVPPPVTIPTCPEPSDPEKVSICKVRPNPDSAPVGQYITIEGWHFQNYGLNSEVRFNNALAELISCGANVSWEEIDPIHYPGYFRIKAIVPNVPVGDYKINVLTGSGWSGVYPEGPVDFFRVTAGNPGPSIACLTPETQARGERINISGVGFSNNGTIKMTGWVAAQQVDINFNDVTSWSDTLITGAQIPLEALSSDLTVTVGSLTSGPEWLQVYCSEGVLDCASGCCAANSCVDASACFSAAINNNDGPIIDSISPEEGQEGNLITIHGRNFGPNPGSVVFENNDGGEVAGFDPQTVNSECTQYWSDTLIVVLVPNNTKDAGAKVWVRDQDGTDSNFKIYDDSFGPVPSICRLEPNSGAFKDDVIVHGLKFTAGDRASFGGILDLETNVLTDFKAEAKVPNISPNDVSVWLQTASGVNGNDLLFTVNSQAGGDPIINQITPDSGPRGQYLTILGANFGDQAGTVTFSRGGNDTLADISFPAQCSEDYWRDDSIVVKVPNLGVANDYQVKVTRSSDGKNSNIQQFAVVTGAPGPGICAMQPDNGPANDLFAVSLFGDNFGSSNDVVKFFDNKNASINSWSNQVISARVPQNAQTGPVSVVRDGVTSNALNFAVSSCSIDSDCSAGYECCSQGNGNYCALAGSCPGAQSCEYTWTVTTAAEAFGLKQTYQCANNLQSPSPWPDGLDGRESRDAYLDANIVGLFTRDVIDAGFNNNNIIIKACNSGGEFDSTSCSTVITGDLEVVNNNSDQEGFIFNPAMNLDTNRWYQVSLGTFYSAIGNDSWDGSNFSWHFRTQNATCQVSDIQVTPTVSPQADIYLGGTKDFYATPQGNNCNVCGSNYNWSNWDFPVPADQQRANIELQEINNINIAHARLRAVQVTENSPVPTVELQATLNSLQASAYPKIKDAILNILDYGPNCNQSCVNALLWVRFNTELDSSTVNNSNISIQECVTSDCLDLINHNLVEDVLISENGQEINILHQDFDQQTTYLVNLNTAIKNISGYSLSPAFSWKFTTSNAATCQVDSVRVDPSIRFSSTLGENIDYFALPYSSANSCSVSGQALNPDDYNWTWSVDYPTIAAVNDFDAHQATITTISSGQAEIKALISAAQNNDANAVGQFGLGQLTINQDSGSQTVAPQIVSVQPQTPACLNSALNIQFDQVMNAASLDSSIKLYEKSNTNTGSCLYVSGDISALSPWNKLKQLFLNTANAQAGPSYYWCPVLGETSIVSTRINSRAMFYPEEQLLASQQYLAVVYPSAMGVNGQLLDPEQINYDYNHDGVNDFYAWQFTTNNQICQISFVTVDPSQDVFTCSLSGGCPDDVDNGLAGNQHQYTATAYSASGQALVADDYNWTENNNLLSLTSNAGASILATASNANGQTTLLAEASNANSSAFGSSRIDLFICENPWPRANVGLPYTFNNSAYNFSTFYCQNSGRASDPVLPYLSLDPIIKGANGDTLQEFIFIVDPQNIALTSEKFLAINSWWSNLLDKFKNKVFAAPAVPSAPSDLNLLSNDGQGVRLSWTDNSNNEEGFKVYRKSSSVDWYQIATLEANQSTFTDTSIIAGEVYDYRVLAFNGISQSSFTNIVNVIASVSSLDVIGVRVMANNEHLSVEDWYKRHAPNSGVNGQVFTVDNYQALQVGNTVYIGAANVSGSIYTNIYIISYNIGARESTRSIFEAMVQNMKLSTNISSSNVCVADPSRSCESRFDCLDLDPTTACEADGLDLRRDTKRLGDLVGIQKNLALYGSVYKACDNNSSISCTQDNQCPNNGSCVPYYPLLNSGTYANGLAVSQWPSWQAEFADVLGVSSLPVDPINAFPVCPDGFDQETCWDALNQRFSCPLGSSIYFYKNEGGSDYALEANFEFNASGLNFINNLAFGADSHLAFNAPHCSASFVGLPISSPDCGNGVVDTDEECDGGFRNLCDAGLGDHPWWNEHLGGCYPKGTLDDAGALVECTWYQAQPTLTAAQCGNYCGDGSINSIYELCEGNNFNDLNYACLDGSAPSCNTCLPVCADGSIASLVSCGDGIVQGPEQCEVASYNSPLPGNSSENQQYQCGASCQANIGGYCGDGVVQNNFGEQCESSTPCVTEDGSAGVRACTSSCQNSPLCIAASISCGDGIRNGNEECDTHDLGGQSCQSLGFQQGSLSCDASCNLNINSCSNVTGPDANATIFVTRNSYSGDLVSAATALGYSGSDGLAAADYLCQSQANSAPAGNLLSGTWKAWLSNNATSARDRLVHNVSPYILVTGDVVANNWTDLVDGSDLRHNINFDQNGTEVSTYVHSNTDQSGVKITTASACDNWSSILGSAVSEGFTDGMDNLTHAWTYGVGGRPFCGNVFPIYCLWQGSNNNNNNNNNLD